MGFSVSYQSTRPVTPAEATMIKEAACVLGRGWGWLSCEPVWFYQDSPDGFLHGHSKPNFMPHPDDVASFAKEGLPDGTTREMLEILTRISSDYGIDWVISHDHSDGPVGYIRDGVCDDDVLTQIELFADLCEIVSEAENREPTRPSRFPKPSGLNTDPAADEDDGDGPDILPFRPKGS